MAATQHHALADFRSPHQVSPPTLLPRPTTTTTATPNGDLLRYFLDVFRSRSPGGSTPDDPTTPSSAPPVEYNSFLHHHHHGDVEMVESGAGGELQSPPKSPNSSGPHHGLKQVFEEPSMESVKYVMGKRGGCQIVWQGHRYTRDRTRNDQTYWACVLKRPPYRCKGRISTKRSFVTSATAHNHAHQTSKSQTARLVHLLKQRVQGNNSSVEEASDIVLGCLRDFKFNDTSPGTEELPTFDTLVKMCKRIVKNRKRTDEDDEMFATHKFLKTSANSSAGAENIKSDMNQLLMNCEEIQRPTLSESSPLVRSAFLPDTSSTSSLTSPLFPVSVASPSSLLTPSLFSTPTSLASSLLGGSSTTADKLIGSAAASPSSFFTPGSRHECSPLLLSSLLPKSNTYLPSSTKSAFTSTTSPLNLKMSSAMTLQSASSSPPRNSRMLEKGVSSISAIRSNLDEVELLYRVSWKI
eukprot:sb/3464438/